MPNRQERRRLKKLGLQPHTQEIETQKPAQEKPPIWRSTVSTGWRIFLAAAGIIGFVVTVLSLRPVLEVTTSFQSDPSRPYSEVFVIANGGLLPLYNLRCLCVQDSFKDSGRNSGHDNTVLCSNTVAKIGSGDKTSLPFVPYFDTGHELLEASISIKITYQTLIPVYTAEQSFHFLGIRTKDGSMRWTPQSS